MHLYLPSRPVNARFGLHKCTVRCRQESTTTSLLHTLREYRTWLARNYSNLTSEASRAVMWTASAPRWDHGVADDQPRKTWHRFNLVQRFPLNFWGVQAMLFMLGYHVMKSHYSKLCREYIVLHTHTHTDRRNNLSRSTRYACMARRTTMHS
jgi:hypothetical protein